MEDCAFTRLTFMRLGKIGFNISTAQLILFKIRFCISEVCERSN